MEDFDIREFFNAIDTLREERGLTWAAVLRQINAPISDLPGGRRIATSTLTGMRASKSMIEGDSGLQVLLWLGRAPESFVPGMKWDPRTHLLHQPGNGGILRWDLKKQHEALDAKRVANGSTWRDVAAEIGGYTPAMLTRMAKGGRTSFPGVMRVVRWLDLPAADFTRASPH